MLQTNQLEEKLKQHFHYSTFRKGQREIIEDVLARKDVLGILPTGSGKSICYQLPALLQEGTTIVVSPLISLMIDQVKELKAMNIKRVVALNSFVDPSTRRKIYQNLHQYKLIYVSPELLQQNEILRHLKQINVSLFVVDEAHCISQWGHEFRPDYLKLSNVIELLGNPPVLALSATATKLVQDDIVNSLNLPNVIKHIYPMDRNNIMLTVREVMDNHEKLEILQTILTDYKVPTIIYFSSRIAAEEVSQHLSKHLKSHRISYYHGGMEASDRVAIQQQFINNQLDVICCTSAFGMGINKNDIRLVIHYHFPSQIESYIQEIGRAGRDGHSSLSMVLYSRTDAFLPKNMIENELPSEEQLNFAVRVIKQYHENNNGLPTDENILPILNLNEIQWRFLRYQLEKHDIIKGNMFQVTKMNWERFLEYVNSIRKDRLVLKEDKLTEMIRWLNERRCLRKHLYKNFQESYSKPIEQCCSSCGFSLEKWQPIQNSSKQDIQLNWEKKLQKLLLHGEIG
ncbi:RecQ family ATP-dependent DNA helicase [Ornithinibacillus halophilus]|uniref:ATP-dependent DNA helicase RecQ n=1 Tax=Ornithinibacillus halophilus TaxID=930117 RepID=A0A1M5CSD3_9BACI|nr:ATP-dependent DNA helicase RecQ [Ornithinibacillus halophilus]SHF57606.1 ATP-dependent DNA helicase RecQ [Ornithinibacillus halophilus]